MGKVLKAVGSIFGGAPKATAPAPLATTAADELDDTAKKTKAARASLYSTEGGVAGEEILSGGTSKKSTLLGN